MKKTAAALKSEEETNKKKELQEARASTAKNISFALDNIAMSLNSFLAPGGQWLDYYSLQQRRDLFAAQGELYGEAIEKVKSSIACALESTAMAMRSLSEADDIALGLIVPPNAALKEEEDLEHKLTVVEKAN